MKTLTIGFGLAFIGLASPSFAQSESDALRYSWLQFGGSARTQAIGGASTALGADIGTLNTNPAGLGLFRQSEFSITPGLGVANAKTSGVGSTLSDTQNSLHIANMGLVFTNRRTDDDTDDWRGSSFAVGITRLNDFNTRFHYKGQVDDQSTFFQFLRESTATEADLNDEYGTNGNNITTLDGLGYGAYLTGFTTGRRGQDSIYTISRNGPIEVGETVQRSGSQTQYDFGYGASFRDKVYLGASLGIVSTRFNQVRNYTEVEADANTAFTSLALRDEMHTRGTGLNLRVGVIMRATDQLRLGASVQTPTLSSLTDTYQSSLTTNFSGLEVTYSDGSQETINQASVVTRPSESNYTLTSPFRANVGGTMVLGKVGFVSADAEYVNYGQSRLNFDAQNADPAAPELDFDVENQRISDRYQSALNLRVGGEVRADIFRFRAGFAHYGDPFKTQDIDRARTYYTGGVGLRQKKTFLDLTGVYGTSAAVYSPFTLETKPSLRLNSNENRFTTTFTVGVLF